MTPAGALKTADSDDPAEIFRTHQHNARICGVCLQRHEGLSEVIRRRQTYIDELSE